jgi:hypothetical protein
MASTHLLVARLVLACAALATTTGAAAPPAFEPLFNGRDLSGWHGWAIHDENGQPPAFVRLPDDERRRLEAAWTADAARHWTVQDGELVNDGVGPLLATDREFGDCELRVEFRIASPADGGIYLKETPQVKIWDVADPAHADRGAARGSGGLGNNGDWPGRFPLARADRPCGEWNQLRIIQVGERTTVFLNGTLVVAHARLANFWEAGKPLPRRGRILLQAHGGEVRWRNLRVRELAAEEANRILDEGIGRGFEPIFNGRDFTGWTGPLDAYEVADGAIRCKPKMAGNIHTVEEYADFAVALEFKMPPKGNNGLAIRYPGGGVNAGREGMTEIQILDDGYPGIDPRQVHGSAYGMVPAVGGYQRPHGEWNHQLVTVRGSKVTVELNGFTVLDADLATVTAFMDDKPHPGKDRKSGFFGLCGHHDAVEFRRIRIRRLPAP